MRKKRKETARSWIVNDGQSPGWQNTSQFMTQYPSRAERRAFYQRRTLYYRHVRLGKASRTRADLDRYMGGAVKEEAVAAQPASATA